MKKYFLLVALASYFAACKKDYTCTCKVPASGTQPEQTSTYELKEVKKSNAKNSCRIANDNWALAGGSCELKK
jgi:hypothetical protein